MEDAAIEAAVKMQEAAGLQVATDGEFRREFWHMDFLSQFNNAEMYDAGIKVRFHSAEGDIDFAPPGIRVVGKLSRPPEGIFVKDFEFLKIGHEGHAEANYSLAHQYAFSRRQSGHRCQGLPRS